MAKRRTFTPEFKSQAVCIPHSGNTATRIWEGREDVARKEGVMSPDDLARVAVTMAVLPPEVNMFESTVLPVKMPYLVVARLRAGCSDGVVVRDSREGSETDQWETTTHCG